MLIHIEQVHSNWCTKENKKYFNPRVGGFYTTYPRQKG